MSDAATTTWEISSCYERRGNALLELDGDECIAELELRVEWERERGQYDVAAVQLVAVRPVVGEAPRAALELWLAANDEAVRGRVFDALTAGPCEPANW